MMAPDEYLAGQAKRFQELRLSLGYETLEDFAAAIGWSEDRYFRYEHLGIVRTSALRRLVKAVKASGHDSVNYDGLLSLEAAKICGRVYHRPGRWTGKPQHSAKLAAMLDETHQDGTLVWTGRDREWLIQQIAWWKERETAQEVAKHQAGNVHVGPWEAPC